MWRVLRVAIAILGVCALPLALSNPKRQLEHDMPDVKKVFEGFRAGLALSDIDNDGDLDCVTATQQDYNASVPSVTYVWHLQAVNGHEARNIYFYVCAGDAPGQILFKDKNVDGPLQEGTVFYSDYKDCIVLDLPYGNSQECMLWISWEAKNNVPQRCTAEYEDTCDDAKLTFDDETCSPFFELNGS
ncbi:uncharacterized protein [Dermacentor andersoni]|uniref:uncharacterized protein n=1 Tax=Dermacentor andersoni TaxID=34620 RepID=UPI0024180992|nr:uncharacterized protein LOC126540926 [Dermacentor andersoni]